MTSQAITTTLTSFNPANGETVWTGKCSSSAGVDKAVKTARKAFETWCLVPIEQRVGYLEAYKKEVEGAKDLLAEMISKEMGKPLWESLGEVGAMIGKIAISVEAYQNRCRELEGNQGSLKSITRHKPHGVVAVFGPFNFPGHLPNGHIVPALLAGNTVVFKPSELTPATGEFLVSLINKAGFPPGVVNLVQGGVEVGKALSGHPEINGLFFTGSSKTGSLLSEQFGKHPEKILALEMGGNNPLVVGSTKAIEAAVYTIIQSAYLTAGQRCTCARRLILPQDLQGDAVLNPLMEGMGKIRVGTYNEDPKPFMGPVVSKESALHLLQVQRDLEAAGAKVLVPMRLLKEGTGLLSPGLIDVTAVKHLPDEEHFGPLLQVIRVPTLDAAINEANNTRYGLSAGILSDKKEEFDRFYQKIHAGIVNWNTQTTGASSAMPFGGVGISGNHRPSAYYAADYCAYPVASLESPQLTLPHTLSPGLDR